MANLVLTRRCNKSCSFCFAPNDESGDMPFDEALRLAEAEKMAGEGFVSLIGGEPTLHADFPKIVAAVVEMGLKLRVFSHGLLGKAAIAALAKAPADRVVLVCNASATLSDDGSLAAGVLRTLAQLGQRACLGVTVDGSSRPYRALLPLYDRFGLARWFRLGVAQPTLEGSNNFSLDYRDPALATLLMDLLLGLAAQTIRVNYDCGFVKCTFSASQRRALDDAGIPLRSMCGAMPDFAPNGLAWPCYPLSSKYTTSHADAETSGQLRLRMNDGLRGVRALGLYPECPSCEFFADRSCAGGCAARIVREFRPLGTPRRRELPVLTTATRAEEKGATCL